MNPALRVLLVDDTPSDRFAVRRALDRDEEQVWALEAMSSAEEALARISVDPPDVVLVDFKLPGMTGLDMLRELCAKGRAPLPALVMLTGRGNERVAVDAMKSGAQDYLVKDTYSAERLRHCLKAAVDTVRMVRELEERRAQTELAERAAREALAVRDELFSLATHDLKGPLQIMTLNAQLLQRQFAKSELGAAQASRLEHITRAAHRMGELIDQFLDATRSEEKPLDREPMDLLALVRSKVHALEASGRHRFVLHLDGGDYSGHWDTRAMERVLENLLGNAVKYSAEGTTVTVTLDAESSTPRGHVSIQVTDEGMGIPSDDLPFVFERFRRGRNVSPGVTGSGVGLASARRLVELHGGTIHVESQEGRGATFIVRLPRGASQLEAPSAEALLDAAPATSSTR